MSNTNGSIPGQASIASGAILVEGSKPVPVQTPGGIHGSLSGVREAARVAMEETAVETRMAKLLASVSGAIELTPEGLFVLQSKLLNPQAVFQFVNQVFLYDGLTGSKGMYFVFQNIDLNALQNVMYPDDSNSKGLPKRIRIASGIRPFPEARKELYRKVSPLKDRNGITMEAKYFFEKLCITETVSVAVPGSDEPQMLVRERETTLDFDEFVTHLWRNGIVSCIRADEVKAFIGQGANGIRVVASGRAPVLGSHARIKEEKKDIRKNMAPKEHVSGLVDFGQFAVSFPEVHTWEKIFCKVPPVPGTAGRDILGNLLPVEECKDLILAQYAGPGTSVITEKWVEYIVANAEWFLSIDQKTQLVTVGTSIVQNTAIAHHTTGNLRNLRAVMEVVGDVEDGRIMDGKWFTIAGQVSAKLIRATESDIAISGSVRNGRLEATFGNIFIQKGTVSNEILSAPQGTVEIAGNAESGTVIYAKKAIVHGLVYHALVIADEIEIQGVVSSQILGKRITIETADSKRGVENIVFVEVPNPERQEKRYESLTKDIKAAKERVALLQAESAILKEQTPAPIERIVTFLSNMAAIKAKSEIMKESDRILFKAILPYMEIVKKYVKATKEIAQIQAEIFKMDKEREEIGEAILQSKIGIGATVKCVLWSTRIHTVRFEKNRDTALGYPKFLGHPHDISSLNSNADSTQLLFDGTSGSVAWKLVP